MLGPALEIHKLGRMLGQIDALLTKLVKKLDNHIVNLSDVEHNIRD